MKKVICSSVQQLKDERDVKRENRISDRIFCK